MQSGGSGSRWPPSTWREPGWRSSQRNWRCRDGELDLVARDGRELVFVEVKTRSSIGVRARPPRRSDRRKAARIRGWRCAGSPRTATARPVRLGPLRRGRGACAVAPDGRARRAPARGVLMALACALAVALAGLDGQLVEVECDIAAGLPGLSFTGLPDASVVESRDRLRAAVQNTGADWPNRRITVALLPADVRKVGSALRPRRRPRGAGRAGAGPGRRRARGGLARRAGARRRAAAGPGRAAVGARRPRRRRRRVVVAAGERRRGRAGGRRRRPRRRAPRRDRRVADRRRCRRCQLAEARPDVPRAPGRTRTSPTSPGSSRPSVRSRSRPPVGITVPARRRRVPARRCWPSGCPACCRRSTTPRRSRSPPSTRSPVCSGRCRARAPAAAAGAAPHRLDRGAGRRRVATWPGRARSASPTAACCSWTRRTSSRPRALDALRQPLETGTVVLHRGGGAVRYPARFQLVLAANPCACALPRRRLRMPAAGPAAPPAAAVRAAARPGRPARTGGAGRRTRTCSTDRTARESSAQVAARVAPRAVARR